MTCDAAVICDGPNDLAAVLALARAGLKGRLIERNSEVGVHCQRQF